MAPAGVIAVVRAATPGECRTIVRGLVRAAVPAIELTMTVPDAVTIIGELADSGMASGTVLGAGTVLDPAACAACVAAGATFIVSPVTDPGVLEQAHRRGVPYIGGALTPTEVLASMRAGSDAIKLFPVGAVGGVDYLRALREPLPALRAVVSGGITAGEASGYLAAGAHAVAWDRAALARLQDATPPTAGRRPGTGGRSVTARCDSARPVQAGVPLSPERMMLSAQDSGSRSPGRRRPGWRARARMVARAGRSHLLRPTAPTCGISGPGKAA
jgi:2-dehydro-3-deoxyphosphogluconate aldolase/(4S)-4-hydroxy-2-oxoglutarate aldolase